MSEDRKQLAKELHAPIRKRFKRRKVIVHSIDDIWASDLVVMPPERSYRYILTVLDIFSKYAWAIPLQTKTGIEITECFKKIFKESGRQFKKLFVDRGTEYYNKIFLAFLKDNNCEIYLKQS